MKHEATVVEGSLEHTSVHGVAFTVRCCGDTKTDARAHIQDAGHLEPTDLRMKMERVLREHAELHAKATGAKLHMENLVAGGIAGCCREDTHS